MRVVTRYVGSGIKGDSGIRRMGSQITSLGSGITDHEIGLAVFLGIRDQAVSYICGIRDTNWSRFWNQGSEICIQKLDEG